MTPGERLTETFRLIREATPWLLRGTPEQVDRKFALLERENNLRNQRMLSAIARTRKIDEIN
jgi:hypothetical protein